MIARDQSTAGVTVVIPAYNYERYLAEAVESALNQDHAGEVEVLVIDDGSTDNTAAIALSYGERLRYHRKANAGLSAARNTGMEMAKHERVLFLDADDVLEPNCVRRLVEVWDQVAPAPIVAVGSLAQMIDAEGNFLGSPEGAASPTVESVTAKDFVLRNRFSPIVLADRKALLALGGFDPALKASEDRDMWIRAATAGLVLKVNEPLHRKRDHGSNMSRQAERQTQCMNQVHSNAANNPLVQLTPSEWRQARAICLHQSARMYMDAGDARTAAAQCLRSIREFPWFTDPQVAGMPPLFRVKFLLLAILSQFGLRRP